MALDGFAHPSSENSLSKKPSIMCTQCHTPKHLILESLESCTPRVNGRVSVEYSCGNCESFYAHDVPVQDLAKFLHTESTSSGILHFGGTYIHCGESMEERGTQLPNRKSRQRVEADVVRDPKSAVAR